RRLAHEHDAPDARNGLQHRRLVPWRQRAQVHDVRREALLDESVSCAAAVDAFPAAAAALLGQIVAAQAIDEATLELVEGLAGERGGWESLTVALEAAAEKARASLTPELYAFVAARVALWHRDRRGDPAAAREALL